MKKILADNNLVKPPKVGEIVEGKVVGKGKASVYLDLGTQGTGIIYGKEFYDAKEEIKKLQDGDSVFAKISDLENEEGYIELSLAQANREMAWKNLRELKQNDEAFPVKISGANKGGLLAKVSGVSAFLPASQLSPENYPKVKDGDSQEILKSLQKLVGKELEVKIFDLDPQEDKLILSERTKENERAEEILNDYKVGDVVEGEITGVVDFGAFIKFPVKAEEANTVEGLIHISELDWQLIEDPSEIVKSGEKVKAKIVDISNGKASLSLKALKKDPWEGVEKKFKKGDVVEGKVKKFNPFGAFVQVTDKIQGLCHISEFGTQKKMEESLEIGKKYKFEILSIDPKNHKMSLKPAK